MKLVSWLLILTSSLVLAGLLAFGLSGTVRDAVEGHVTDITERVSIADETVAGTLIGYGKFREDDPGNDAAHWVKGTASLVWDEENDKHYIQLEDDFQAGLAPDLYIYVSTSATPIVKLLILTGSLMIAGLLAFGLSGTVRDAVEGHVTDITERVTVADEVASGDVLTTAVFREDDPGNDAAHWVKGSVSIVEMDGKKYVQLNDWSCRR